MSVGKMLILAGIVLVGAGVLWLLGAGWPGTVAGRYRHPRRAVHVLLPPGHLRRAQCRVEPARVGRPARGPVNRPGHEPGRRGSGVGRPCSCNRPRLVATTWQLIPRPGRPQPPGAGPAHADDNQVRGLRPRCPGSRRSGAVDARPRARWGRTSGPGRPRG